MVCILKESLYALYTFVPIWGGIQICMYLIVWLIVVKIIMHWFPVRAVRVYYNDYRIYSTYYQHESLFTTTFISLSFFADLVSM